MGSNWYFNPGTNAISFSPPLTAGETVEVRYLPSGSTTSYSLADMPDVATMVVSVNGSVWTSGWSYNGTTNSIQFAATLVKGELINVEYMPWSSLVDLVLSDVPDPATMSVMVSPLS